MFFGLPWDTWIALGAALMSAVALLLQFRHARTGLKIGTVFGDATTMMERVKGSELRPYPVLVFNLGFTVFNNTQRPNSVAVIEWNTNVDITEWSGRFREFLFDYNPRTNEGIAWGIPILEKPISCSEVNGWQGGAALPIGPGECRNVRAIMVAGSKQAKEVLEKLAEIDPHDSIKLEWPLGLVIRDAYGKEYSKTTSIKVVIFKYDFEI